MSTVYFIQNTSWMALKNHVARPDVFNWWDTINGRWWQPSQPSDVAVMEGTYIHQVLPSLQISSAVFWLWPIITIASLLIQPQTHLFTLQSWSPEVYWESSVGINPVFIWHVLYFGNYSTENISLIMKFKVKYFRGYIRYFYLEHISLAIIHGCSCYHSQELDCRDKH